jgi:hypothetical protein
MTLNVLSAMTSYPVTRRLTTTGSEPIALEAVKPLSTAIPESARVHVATPVRFMDPTSMIQAMRDAGVTSDDHPSKLFAEVYKNGQVVARLYNGGSSVTYGQADGIITGADEPYDDGPQLAQWRANKIATAMGGTVKMADTAQTQSQWALTSAAETAQREQAMAPYRAAMDAFRAALDLAKPVPAKPLTQV